MPAIETVTLFGNRITSIPELTGVPNLKALGLGVNQITDITGLSGLTSLEIVDLTNNRITAIGALTDLPNLIYMDLQNNQIADISGLAGLPNLIFVLLNRNRVETLDALSDLPKLRFIELSTNQITDIAGLAGLPSLETVDLSYNQIEAIPALSELPNLRSMDLRNNRITDIAGLAGLVVLDLANNDIEDVAILSGPTNLKSLDLSNNLIEDISALTTLHDMDLLDLLYNPLDEDAYVYNVPAIEANNPGIEISYNPCPWACERRPYAGAGDITHSPVLRWTAGAWAAVHDVYFGRDEELLANATTADTEIYRGRQELDMVMYKPETLEWGTTYYCRIDEVNFVAVEAEDGTEDVNEIVWKGQVWSFTTAEFIVVDDFELYTDNRNAGQAVFQAWIDGLGFSGPEPNNPGNGTGSIVGHDIWTQDSPHETIAETGIVHSGRQSLPLYYNNADEPYYSQTSQKWPVPQDWTLNGMDTFEFYFRGALDNGSGQLYLLIEDDAGQIAAVVHPNSDAVLANEWQQWSIPLADLIAAGVNVTAIRKISIGVGDLDNPQPGNIGIIYADDIWVIQSKTEGI